MYGPTIESSDRGSDHNLFTLLPTDTSSLHSVNPELDERVQAAIQLLSVASRPLSESDDKDGQHEESQGWNAARDEHSGNMGSTRLYSGKSMFNSDCDAHVMHSIPTVPPRTNDSTNAAVASARQAYEVADLHLRRVRGMFEVYRDRYAIELKSYVQKRGEQATAETCGQNDADDSLEREEEFGRSWFRKNLEITEEFCEAEREYKIAEERWEALVLAQNPHAFAVPTREYEENITTESIEEELPERKRKEIEYWIEETSG